MDFSIGIPVWNEESILVENTSRLCNHLERLGGFEIIIVSNGSTDRTAELGRMLASKNARIRFFEIPERDVAAAFRMMLQEVRCDFLISLDMDLPVDFKFIEQALTLLRSYDLVIGSKKLGNQSRSWVRRFGSDLYIRCANRLLLLGVEDYSMGAKGYRVSFFKKFLDRLGHGTSYAVNCIYLARWNGGKIVEVPVSCRDFRKSKFSLWHEAYHKFSHLIGLWVKHELARKE
ncbi:glycosyltransferase family 2 protein [Acidobacteria bacterium AH-259-D05]|nr:glycosyltransferase family 2 protein [Acidobacteria bacterium AH-259-D05]